MKLSVFWAVTQLSKVDGPIVYADGTSRRYRNVGTQLLSTAA